MEPDSVTTQKLPLNQPRRPPPTQSKIGPNCRRLQEISSCYYVATVLTKKQAENITQHLRQAGLHNSCHKSWFECQLKQQLSLWDPPSQVATARILFQTSFSGPLNGGSVIKSKCEASILFSRFLDETKRNPLVQSLAIRETLSLLVEDRHFPAAAGRDAVIIIGVA